MKKITLTLLLLLTLSTYSTLATNNLQQAKAQTAEIEYPIIEIISPTNNTLYNKNFQSLSINITIGESTNTSLISHVSYQTSWNPTDTTTFSFDPGMLRELMAQLSIPRQLEIPIHKLYQILYLTDIPEGNHNITISTHLWYYSSMVKQSSTFEEYYRYYDVSYEDFSDIVFFSTDSIIPTITFPSLKNKTYTSSNVTLNYIISENVSHLKYSLDEQEQVLSQFLEIREDSNFGVFGELSLDGLDNGEHDIVLYAVDEAGNVGVSETLYFVVDTPEPFPTTIVVSIVTIAVIGVGILVYFKKYRK